MNAAALFNPHLPNGQDVPSGINRHGITFPLGHGMGLTITVPWILIALGAYGIYWLGTRR